MTFFVRKITIIFIHAISGCDTTSRTYGIGKTSAKDKTANLHEHALEWATKSSSKVAKRSEYPPPENLPPTEVQVQAWLGNITLNPNKWGYELKGGHLRAVRMVNPAAPDYLLNCNWKSTCSTLSCSLRA